MKKLIILFLNLFLLIAPNISLSVQREVILEHAGYAEYLEKVGEKVVTLKEGIKLIADDISLEADLVQLNLTQEELVAKGTVVLVTEQGDRIESEEVKYNLKTKQGRMKTPYIFVKPYYCKGYEACYDAGTITFYNTSLTTCGLSKPHYSLTSAKSIIYPNDKIIAKNVFFKIGNVPVFYLPYFSISLKPRKSQIIIKPGKSNEKGNSLGFTYSYFFTPKSIGALHLNFLENQGIGCAIEHKYEREKELYFYYINEHKKREDVKDTRRWELSTRQIQRVKDITGILHIQLLSDKNVTRDYLREERPRVVTWELKNYLALTKNHPNYTLSLINEQLHLWDSEAEDFKKGTTFLPKLTLQTKSVNRNNIYSNLKIEVINRIDSNNTHHLGGDVGVNLLKNANFLNHRVVFSPKIGFLGRVKEDEKPAGWIDIGLNLRNRVSKYLEIDLNHNLKKMFKPDEHHRIEKNTLVPTLHLWVNRAIRGEITGGVNFRHKHDSSNKTHLLPLISNFNLALSDNLVTSLKTIYNSKSSKIEETEIHFNLTKDKWQYSGSGFYYRTSPTKNRNILEISNCLSFKISPTTYMQLYMYYDLREGKTKENRLTIEKDLHCWKSKFSIRHGEDTEFLINFSMK